jgi:Sulfotransferase family
MFMDVSLVEGEVLSDPSPVAPRRGPIFIVGAMGSGTTLLRLVLDSHERIAIPPETGFMRAYDAHRFTPFKHSGRGWTKRLGWSPEELDAVMSELYDRLFTRYATQHGKARWGEKTPLHTWHLEDMARVFPDAQFIGPVRHPCASVASNLTRFRLPLGRAGTHWKRYTTEIVRNAALLGDRFAILRYEDLVLEPEPLLKRLLEWLGEPWSGRVLEHHAVQRGREHEFVEGRNRRDDPLDSARVDKWTRTLPIEQRRWLEQRVARQADFFGYAMDQPAAVRSLAADGGPLILGSELDARVEEFPDLELRTRPKPPIYDQHYDPRELVALTREQFEKLTRRRGLRALGVRLTRLLPRPGRRAAIRLVRSTRSSLGLRRRPPRI